MYELVNMADWKSQFISKATLFKRVHDGERILGFDKDGHVSKVTNDEIFRIVLAQYRLANGDEQVRQGFADFGFSTFSLVSQGFSMRFVYDNPASLGMLDLLDGVCLDTIPECEGTLSYNISEHLQHQLEAISTLYSEAKQKITLIKVEYAYNFKIGSHPLLVIPPFVTDIAEGAFSSLCRYNLEGSINNLFPSYRRVLDKDTFREDFTFDIWVGNAVEVLDEGCFAGVDAIRRVFLGMNINHIKSRAFMDCCNLSEVYFLAFYDSTGVLNIIDDCAFKNCTSLKHINLPASIKYIGDECFYNCYNLDTLFAGFSLFSSLDGDDCYAGKDWLYGCDKVPVSHKNRLLHRQDSF